jgi:Tfp pilus assembly protein PilV
MRRNVVIRALIAFIALTAGISGLITQSAHAQATNATAAQGIQISPALAQLNADPGKSYTVKVTVTNVTSSNLVYTTTIDDFKAKDETGTPEILANDTLPPTASVRTWIQAVPQFNMLLLTSLQTQSRVVTMGLFSLQVLLLIFSQRV